MTSFLDSSGHHVVYLGSNAHVYCLYYNPRVGSWVDEDLTTIAHGPAAHSQLSGLTSFSDQYGEHISYLAPATVGYDVHQLYWNSSNGWVDYNLTAIAGGGSPLSLDAGLTSFADGVGEHVFYLAGVSGAVHVYELYWHYGINWTAVDITLAAAPNQPLPDSELTSFADANGEHVYYVNSQNPEAYEYFFDFNQGSWTGQVLASPEAVPPDVVGGITSLPSAGGTQNVAFFGSSTPNGCAICLFETQNVLGGNLQASELTVVPPSDWQNLELFPLVSFIDP